MNKCLSATLFSYYHQFAKLFFAKITHLHRGTLDLVVLRLGVFLISYNLPERFVRQCGMIVILMGHSVIEPRHEKPVFRGL